MRQHEEDGRRGEWPGVRREEGGRRVGVMVYFEL